MIERTGSSRRRGVAGGIAFVAMTLVACGGGREPEPPTTPVEAVCGARLFESPRCENAVNEMCCTSKVDCVHDPVCSRLSDCSLACKHAALHDTCVSTCVTRETPSPDLERGLALWRRVLDCASKANVPDCGDDS